MVLEVVMANPTVQQIVPLVIFIFGMTVYGIFVFKFYRYLASMNVFDLNLAQYNRAEHPFIEKLVAFVLYVAEYLFVFPLLIFFWFAIIVVLLTFMSQQSLPQIALLAMGLVGAVRVTAYYSEDLSRDMAKMMPFALLGVFIVDLSIFQPSTAVQRLLDARQIVDIVVVYLGFILILELGMRFAHFLRGRPDVSSSE